MEVNLGSGLLKGELSSGIKTCFAPLAPYFTITIGLLVFQNAWIAIWAYHGAMLVIMCLTGTDVPVKSLLKSRNYLLPVLTALPGASAGLLLFILWPFLSINPEIASNLHSVGLSWSVWPYFLAYFILINPFLEEYYWRGYLGSNSKRIVLNDLFFP
jgi:membrane protease YdiL (CAAX protease family)